MEQVKEVVKVTPPKTSETKTNANTAKEEPKSSSPNCPMYKLPELPAPIPLPIEQLDTLAKSGKDDSELLRESDIIISQHLEAVHLNTRAIHDILEKSYQEYLAKCGK